MGGKAVVIIDGDEYCGIKGRHIGSRDGRGGRLMQGKRQTNKANMDNVAINNHGDE